MKILVILFTLLLSSVGIAFAHADNVRLKMPAIHGKLIANNLVMTDWQTVMSCYYNYQGTKKESLRYPLTILNKQDGNTYSLKIKAASFYDYLPRGELLSCAYKLILIGKHSSTHQIAFGEILLMGKDSGTMNDTELQAMFDQSLVTKTLNDRTRELVITYGKDGGIVEDI